ncbi:cupin-like domain-containing protein [Saccharophagus degradans]|uniref:cupin-like domain-containing protein n=1 Tax=Saccharophagus degradans TaxID=86304 RepID=UPI002477FCD1|nr:cupin-like domain-containing protein [Saccharophagus degradans]WGO99110.1 cupin-like domain-containing protein [Saccharophagus degradans]
MMKKESNVQSVLKVLDYTKTNKKWFDEKELVAGYHSVSILGEKIKGQRDPEMRLAKVDYDFADKRVLDVGCSNGGLLHALSDQVAFGVGVDFNAKCINAANALKAINRRDNIHFYTFDLDKEDLLMLNHFVFGESVDICFFFNISLWVKRWKEVFLLCSDITQTLLFEAHGNEDQQAEQLSFVRSVYRNVKLLSEQSDDDPTYAKRKMYLCENKVQRSVLDAPPANAEFLKVFNESAVKEAYEAVFQGESAHAIRFFPNTHESVVAEVNGDYIVKLPKPHRGVNGVTAEQRITDFLSGKVELPIPSISVHPEPVILVRYRKLSGDTFDKNHYMKLSEANKNNLAAQLAKFIADLHEIPSAVIQGAKLALAPSWKLKPDLIEEQLSSSDDEVIKALLPEVLRNQRAIKVPESNVVFGHFDLHGGNVLLDKEYAHVSGVIDFGNCKLGDLHQDLSTMNLSSPDLTVRIVEQYEQLTNKNVNRLLVQHYTTIFYLNLLAGLKRNKTDDKFKYWLGELHRWYDHLINERATSKLKAHKPVTNITSSWRKWIASNLMKGGSPLGVQKILREQGYSPIDIAAEIQLATEHPYVQAGQEIFHTLNKRNWLLKTCDTLAALDHRYSTKIEVIETPSFDVFVRDYYSKHLPVVLTKGIQHWQALEKWNPSYLLQQFGEKEIEVQFDRDKDPLFERNSGKHKKRMLMREFVGLVNSGGDSNNYYMTANNTKNSVSAIESLFDDLGDFGEGYRPLEDLKAGTFFWFGPKGTFTPIHHDLTNNMLVQIMGRKKVTLIPAWQVPWLYNDKGVFSATDFPSVDANRYPLMKNISPVEVFIGPGDALFIPVGWWHCVESLDVSISISFTNFNVPNQFSTEFPKG